MTLRTLGFAFLWCASGPGVATEISASDGQLVLVGGTILASPTEDPITDGVVVIRDGTIAAVGRRGSVAIPRGVATLDCAGLTIVAGFWNSHVHFFERKWADAAAIPGPELAAQLGAMLTRFGFTSVFDLGSPWENTRRIRDRIESGEVSGPRIRSTGEGLVGKGALPPQMDLLVRVLGVMPPAVHEVGDGASALAASKKLLDAGTDGLKLHVAAQFPPFATLPDEVIRAAVQEAHRRPRPVFAHPQSREGLLAAANGGVDILAHTTPQSDPWDDTLLKAMRQANAALIPTLKIWIHQLRHDRASASEARARVVTEQLRAWLRSGGVTLFGTDVGGMDDYDPSDEYALMAEAGMTFREILASLTTTPAEKFGEAGRLGRIAPGFAADLVVLNGDPSRDPRALAAVRHTLRSGKVIYPAAR